MALEYFFGADQGEGMSEAAFEVFKEKMKKAAAQIAAIKKEEGKQKKKEEELLKILSKFVKTSQKKDLVLLISRALEQNIPANFILAVILLGNEDIQKEIGSFLMLKGAVSEEKALTFFREDKTLPLKIRIELDNWMKSLLMQALETPQKLLKSTYEFEMIEIEKSEFGNPKFEEKKRIKPVLIQLAAFVMRDFLEQNKIVESYSKLKEFAEFFLKGILAKTQEALDNRKFLKD